MKRLRLAKFRNLSLDDWDVRYMVVAGPGQLYHETVIAEALYLTDDGRLVIVTTPFPNLAKPGAKNAIEGT